MNERQAVKRLFFFCKQKTAYEIAECVWSSDVCSSDLPVEDWWKEVRDEEGTLLQAEVNPESQSIDIYNVNTIQDKYVCILSVENVFPYPTPMIL